MGTTSEIAGMAQKLYRASSTNSSLFRNWPISDSRGPPIARYPTRSRRSSRTRYESRGNTNHARRSNAQTPRTSASIRSDRKSTRLNSSHANISYAVFCLKKKKQEKIARSTRRGRQSARDGGEQSGGHQ